MCTVFQTRVITKTKQLGKSHEFCGGRHCFSYCSWPPVQQKSRLLIGLNCIIFYLNNSSQIAKKFFITQTFSHAICLQILETVQAACCQLNKHDYNIPRACLLNRSPVPAMDLKSNRSGLWGHMLAELVVGWEDYVASVQTMSRDMIKLQLRKHFCRATKILCRATWVSCRIRVTLYCDFYTFRSCNTCTFSLPTFAVLRHTT